MIVQKVLADALFSMRQLADEAGVSYSLIRGWKIGRKAPLPASLRRLADALRRRGRQLLDMADELERAADQREGE